MIFSAVVKGPVLSRILVGILIFQYCEVLKKLFNLVSDIFNS